MGDNNSVFAEAFGKAMRVITISILEIVYVIFLFSTLITSSWKSAILTAVLMAIIFPPVYDRIPKFKGKLLAAIVLNIFFILVSLYNLNIEDSSTADNEPSVEVTTETETPEEVVEVVKEDPPEKKNPEAMKTPDKPVVTSEVEEPVEEIKDEKCEEEEKKEFREYMDSLSDSEWIHENILNKMLNDEDFDHDGFSNRSADRGKFYREWLEVVEEYYTSEYNISDGRDYKASPELLEEYCDFLQASIDLICEMYPDCANLNDIIKPMFDKQIVYTREFAKYLHEHNAEYLGSKGIVNSGNVYTPSWITDPYKKFDTYSSYYDKNEEYNNYMYGFGEESAAFENFIFPIDSTERERRNSLLD